MISRKRPAKAKRFGSTKRQESPVHLVEAKKQAQALKLLLGAAA